MGSKDLKITWDDNLFTGDFDVLRGDLATDSGITTAVILSLFTERRAAEDDPLPDPDNLDRRGWWGDLINPYVEGDQIGSKMWLLEREKTIDSVLIRAKQYLDEALTWLIDDGVCTKIDTYLERQGDPGQDQLAYIVTIYKNDEREINLNFNLQWENS